MHKVLIVDDEQEILETIGELIEDKFHCGVDRATNGLDAFLMCMKEKYDVIITDHKMPFMTGAAFIIATRTKENMNKATPFVMLSGFIDDELQKNLSVQQVEFLTKPVMPNTLFDAVRTYLL
jgi:YesN/AraC family two-component response regulator